MFELFFPYPVPGRCYFFGGGGIPPAIGIYNVVRILPDGRMQYEEKARFWLN
jgi:hypothetical protein